MINITFGTSLFLSLISGIAILLFYGVRRVRPELSRDEDLFFVTIAFFYSGILGVHGWRLDPILLFSQVLVIILLVFAIWENIRLRGILMTRKTGKKTIANKSRRNINNSYSSLHKGKNHK